MTGDEIMAAYERHRAPAQEAYRAFVVLCGGVAPPRVPGMSTDIRLAVRIENGCTVERAAAKEYLYRWNLAIDRSRAFGAPHALGL